MPNVDHELESRYHRELETLVASGAEHDGPAEPTADPNSHLAPPPPMSPA